MSFATPHKLAIVVALEREVRGLIDKARRVEREYGDRKFTFFEHDETVIVCGGIGIEGARRAAEAVIALYHPAIVQSAGFAGALDADLHIGDIFSPAVVVDARDGSRVAVEGGNGVLITFMTVADANQKMNLAHSYGAQAVDMEAAAVAAAARAHGIQFAATKVISDELDFEMPETARFIDSQGQFRTTAFAVFAAFRPWLWPRVSILARNSNKAARALAEHLQALRPHLTDVIEAKTS
ncbi:MAG: putative phosphorylase, family 1 [Candidatus Sulfotelmatobacter sp.]|nr:putative phosphorylase, family 1 [Candidatus Sulfotelmatobacter sp.]